MFDSSTFYDFPDSPVVLCFAEMKKFFVICLIVVAFANTVPPSADMVKASSSEINLNNGLVHLN